VTNATLNQTMSNNYQMNSIDKCDELQPLKYNVMPNKWRIIQLKKQSNNYKSNLGNQLMLIDILIISHVITSLNFFQLTAIFNYLLLRSQVLHILCQATAQSNIIQYYQFNLLING
jgi:hypothetical protein